MAFARPHLGAAAFVIFACSSCASSAKGTPTSPDAASDAPVPDCPTGVLGDPSQPIALELRVLKVDGSDAPLADGDDVPLIFPPQGGRVIFVGVRATNLDGCGVQLFGALRDPATNQAQVDGRTVNLVASGDGWGTSGLPSQSISAARASYANVPLCPNQWASVDVFDHEFQLEVKLIDPAGRTAQRAIKVTPRCAEPENRGECLCICKHGYVLGEACAGDAGAD